MSYHHYWKQGGAKNDVYKQEGILDTTPDSPTFNTYVQKHTYHGYVEPKTIDDTRRDTSSIYPTHSLPMFAVNPAAWQDLALQEEFLNADDFGHGQ